MYLREQVVLLVTAGVTLSLVFSLRLVCEFPPSVFTLTLIMKNITGNSLLCTLFFQELYHVSSNGEHFPIMPTNLFIYVNI